MSGTRDLPSSSSMPASNYVPAFDGIRALAIGLVLFYHSVIFGQFSHLTPVGTQAGYVGVVVFFVLSGYLITTLLLREEDRSGSVSLRLFYLRRAIRLLPALWLYLLAVGAFQFYGKLSHHPWHSYVSSLLYVRNIVGRGHETDHLWSLSIEEQFYILWPLLFVALSRRNRSRLLAASALFTAVTVWRIYAAETGSASVGALYFRSDFRFDAPLFGCMLALTLRLAPSIVQWSNARPILRPTFEFIGVFGLTAWIVLRLGEYTYPTTAGTFVSLLSGILVFSQVGPARRSRSWLAWKPLVAIGRISYGLYLWQQLCLGPRTDGFELIRTFPYSIAATFAAALASYFLLERPLLRIKDRNFHNPRAAEAQVLNPTGATSNG